MVESGTKRCGLDNQELRRVYWQDHIEKWRRSGQSKQSYCREQGLNPASFYRWYGKLNSISGETPRFIAVELRQSAARYPVEIELGNGVVVRLSNEAEGEFVVGLLRGLGGAC